MVSKQEDILINVRLQIAKSNLGIGNLIGKDMAAAKLKVAELTAEIAKSRVPFAGYALSLMFFGQQIQKLFTGLAKSALSTFDDVAHSMSGMVTATDLLNGEWTYLKYSLGDALQPIIEWLVPIVSAIADWVSENQSLAAGLVVTAIVLGGILALGGALKLAIDGFTGALIAVKGASGGITAVGAAIAGLIVGFVIVGYYILKLKSELGSWYEFFLAVARGIARAYAVVASALYASFASAWNLIKMGWNGVVTFIESGINVIVSGVNALINSINKLSGGLINIPTIKFKADFSAVKANTKSISSAYTDAFGSGMESYFGLEEKYLTSKPQQAATQKPTVVYNQNTINVQATTAEGMEAVNRAFRAQGIGI
jgi:ABC-type Co2+ transport system permease subunit